MMSLPGSADLGFLSTLRAVRVLRPLRTVNRVPGMKVGGAGLATVDEPETGPRFGMDGLVIRMDPGAERCAAEQQEAAHTLATHPRRTRSPHSLHTRTRHTPCPNTLATHSPHVRSPHTLLAT